MDPYKAQADLLKALAHPVRLHILEILTRGEACVCHLTTILDQRQPYVSQQLMTLRDANLVEDRRDGNVVYYRLKDEKLAQVIATSRQVLQATNGPVEFQDLPCPPIAGCPCPHCEASTCCS